MAHANINAEHAEHMKPDRVKKLRDKILRAVVRKVCDGEILHFREYADHTLALPPLRRFPLEFRQVFTDSLVDEDMKDDLQRHKIINWLKTIKTLYPIKTPADGNCLLHAVSKYVFGLDDRELFLRRLLYVTLSSDTQGKFKKRWLLNQRTLTAQQNVDVRLDTEVYGVEWDSILKATEDCAQGGNNALPYCTLESVHLYLLANIFRRPVIVLADKIARNVFGQSLQDSHIGGIYLPLEWSASQCHRQPILIGYNMNHFAPLLMEEGAQSETEQAVPIVTRDLVSLEVKYMLPEEEVNCSRLLENYLDVTEIRSDSSESIPAVRITHKLLPDKYNVIEYFRKNCEKQLRKTMDEEAGINSGETAVVQIPVVEPFQFQKRDNRGNDYVVIGNNLLPAGAINIIGNGTITVERQSNSAKVKPRQTRSEPQRCLTMGCKMYGNPDMNFMCSKCFNDFTIQYSKQEEAARRQKRQQQQAELLHIPQAVPFGSANRTSDNKYHDLSMMGEDCKCGFKCSTETYPYCHECYPGPNKTTQTRNLPLPPQPGPEPEEVELSYMPDQCYVQGCTFNCSKATFPYCHQCYDLYGAAKTEIPTAPPHSIPMEVDPVDHRINTRQQLRIQSNDTGRDEAQRVTANTISAPTAASHINAPADDQQTELLGVRQTSGELHKKCKTQWCKNKAIKGNDGVCDECYNVSLFGAGNCAQSPPDQGVLDHIRTLNESPYPKQCAIPNCTEEVTTPSIQYCLQCFLRGDSVGSRTQNPMSNMELNINIPEIKGEEKILNSRENEQQSSSIPIQSTQLSGPPLTESLGLIEQTPMSNSSQEVLTPQVLQLDPSPQPTQQGSYRKYICSTPGCEGIRNDNGLCYSCTKDQHNIAQSEEMVNRSMLGTPVTNPTAEEEGEDRSQLLVSCTPVTLTEQQEKELNPIITSSKQKVKCASTHCEEMIYPPKKLCEKCNRILEAHRASEALEKNKRSVGGIGVQCPTPGCQFFGSPSTGNYCSSCYKSGAMRRTAPLNSKKNQEATTKHTTAPLSGSMKASGKQCVEPGCNRFGDPVQADRCYQHYEEAMARYKANMTPESIERCRNGPYKGTEFNKTKVPNVVRPQAVRIEQPPRDKAPKIDPLQAAMSKVENSRKSNRLCKNNLVRGCQNYGNSKNKGYCNTCYPEVLRLENMQAGQNQFG